MKALAHKRRRFGYRRLHVLLRREATRSIVTRQCMFTCTRGHKRLFRMYREDGGGSENSPGDCFPDDTACSAQGWPETGHRHAGSNAGANAGANGIKSAVVAGSSPWSLGPVAFSWLDVGSTGRWAAVPHADRGRQLHARMPGFGCRHIAVRRPGGAGIGGDHRAPGKACDDHLR